MCPIRLNVLEPLVFEFHAPAAGRIWKMSTVIDASFNGLYKWELIYPKDPWWSLNDVAFATITYVDCFNHRRLQGEIEPGGGHATKAVFEADHYCQIISTEPAKTQTPEPLGNPGRFMSVVQAAQSFG